MNERRLRLVYAGGIAFNGVALIAATRADETLFAVTFGIVMVYLAIRYWMVVSA